MRNRTDEIRAAISRMNGKPFAGCDLGLTDDNHLSARIRKLRDSGEIAIAGTRKDKSKPVRLFVEVGLKNRGLYRAGEPKAKKQEEHQKYDMTGWSKVYPEFFREPDLSGRVRFVMLEQN